MTPIRIAIHGAAGRMGRRLIALGDADPDLQIVAALEASRCPDLGSDAGTLAGIRALDIPVTSTRTAKVDAVIDFSIPTASIDQANQCARDRVPLVVATTGLTESQQEALATAAADIPIVWAPNMSLAVNLVMKLASVAASALKHHSSGVDVEILERHHRFKEDAPSGTALQFGQVIADITGQASAQHGRHGRPGARSADEIGYHAIRVGDNPGEHTIVFGMLGETVELRVAATSRDCYAVGALAAAKFVVHQTPGLYSMFDVLDL